MSTADLQALDCQLLAIDQQIQHALSSENTGPVLCWLIANANRLHARRAALKAKLGEAAAT